MVLEGRVWREGADQERALNAPVSGSARIPFDDEAAGGLTVEEAARILAVSPKTVKRDWSVARAWLRRELGA